jgi:type II secretory pathway component GspD/PulD (secretin)
MNMSTYRRSIATSILGSIPVIGALFSRKTEDTQSHDLYVLVHAEIVNAAGESGAGKP